MDPSGVSHSMKPLLLSSKLEWSSRWIPSKSIAYSSKFVKFNLKKLTTWGMEGRAARRACAPSIGAPLLRVAIARRSYILRSQLRARRRRIPERRWICLKFENKQLAAATSKKDKIINKWQNYEKILSYQKLAPIIISVIFFLRLVPSILIAKRAEKGTLFLVFLWLSAALKYR